MRKIQDEKSSTTKSTLENSFYLFNTFFYTRYRQGYDNFTDKGTYDNAKSATTKKTQITKFAYDGVKSWWKGVDLFSKDFLVVPINLHLHWSVMIICHPSQFKKYLDYELQFALRHEIEINQIRKQKQEDKKKSGKKIHIDHVGENEYQENFPKQNEEDPYFCILHLDSLRSHSSRNIGNSLVEILYHAWVDTHAVARNMEAAKVRTLVSMDFGYQLDSTKHTQFQRTKYMKVPQQDNSTDCGLFTCNYVQQFATKIKELNKDNKSCIVKKRMFDGKQWDWLNNQWFADFKVLGQSIGTTMRAQLNRMVEECTKEYEQAVVDVKQMEKEKKKTLKTKTEDSGGSDESNVSDGENGKCAQLHVDSNVVDDDDKDDLMDGTNDHKKDHKKTHKKTHKKVVGVEVESNAEGDTVYIAESSDAESEVQCCSDEDDIKDKTPEQNQCSQVY